jgi:hypothetical protein
MIRSEYKYQVWVFDFAQQDVKGGEIGRHTPVGSSSPATRPSLDEGFQKGGVARRQGATTILVA